MTPKEFNLSEKIMIMNLSPVIHGIDPEDVKEFIRLLKSKCDGMGNDGTFHWNCHECGHEWNENRFAEDKENTKEQK